MCKSLLLDHAQGEFDKEIRLLLQSIELGCHTAILNSNDLNLTRMTLIKRLQDEHFISEGIAAALIDMLLFVLKGYKPKELETVKENPEDNSNLKSDIDISAISAIGSIILPKKNRQRLFINKIKSVYEPIFIDYENALKKNGLNCAHFSNNFGSSNNIIGLRFSNNFGSSNNIDLRFLIYTIYKEESEDFISIISNPRVIPNPPFKENKLNGRFEDRKIINMEDLTKEILINDLNLYIGLIHEEISKADKKQYDKFTNK
jgi:hypothetical protein